MMTMTMTMTSTSAATIWNRNMRIPVSGRWRRSSSIRATNQGTALLEAAKLTVDKYIQNGMVIGLGTGNASGMAIHYLGHQLRRGALKDIIGIPMSIAAACEAAKAGVPLDQYQSDASQIDFAFDDADMIEEGTLITVIGRRNFQDGESLIQEKSIVKAAHKVVFIVTEKQYIDGVDGSIPVLIQPIYWLDVAEEIDDMFLGDAEVWRRPSVGHADPHGGDFPLLTREGLNVLDVIFTSPICDLAEVAENLDKINGVAEHGVVYGVRCSAVIASQNGIRIVDNMPKNVS